jgi:protein arginine kinase
MGIHMGRFSEIDIATLNELFLHTQPAHLQRLKSQSLSEEERDIARADFLRDRLNRS